MLTGMTEDDWTTVLRMFAASCSRRGAKGRNDRRFLEALHYSQFTTSPGGPCLSISATGIRCGSDSGG
jgi:hypothetical protein